MKKTLPRHSRITYKRHTDSTVITIPYPEATLFVYLLGVFSFVSVFAWWFGVIEGWMLLNKDFKFSYLALYTGWITAGLLLVYLFIRGSRPSVPQEIIMTNNGWSLSVGIQPFPPMPRRNLSQPVGLLRALPYKQDFHYLSTQECKALTLDKQNGNLCLLIESNGHMIRIGDWLNQAEKEWLFRTLKTGHQTKQPTVVLFSYKESSA